MDRTCLSKKSHRCLIWLRCGEFNFFSNLSNSWIQLHGPAFALHVHQWVSSSHSSLFPPWTAVDREQPTRAAVSEMLWPSRLAIIIRPLSNSLKSLHLAIFPASKQQLWGQNCPFLPIKSHPQVEWSRDNRCYSLHLLSWCDYSISW